MTNHLSAMTNHLSASITQNELDWARAARAAHPKMTSYGFRPGPGYSDNWEADLSLYHLQQVAASRRWLIACSPWLPRATKHCVNSYIAKHRAEEWSRKNGTDVMYLSEGALLLAAIALNVPLRRHAEPHWGAYLGVSKNVVAAMRRSYANIA